MCTSPEMPVRIVYEQEECIEEEICDMSLPKSYKVGESVYKNEVKLEIPETNAVEISALPREIKSEMPLEQSESMLVQNVNLVSDITPFHAKHDILLPNKSIDLCKIFPFEISAASRKILGKIPKLHTKQKRILGSKLVRRAIPTGLVKRKIPLICRPSSKPPGRQNRLNVKISKIVLSKIHYNKKRFGYRLPLTPSFMLNANREGMRDLEKEDKISYRSPPKPPYIVNVNGEVIGTIEKEDLPYVAPRPNPHQNHHQKFMIRVRVSWIK